MKKLSFICPIPQITTVTQKQAFAVTNILTKTMGNEFVIVAEPSKELA